MESRMECLVKSSSGESCDAFSIDTIDKTADCHAALQV